MHPGILLRLSLPDTGQPVAQVSSDALNAIAQMPGMDGAGPEPRPLFPELFVRGVDGEYRPILLEVEAVELPDDDDGLDEES